MRNSVRGGTVQWYWQVVEVVEKIGEVHEEKDILLQTCYSYKKVFVGLQKVNNEKVRSFRDCLGKCGVSENVLPDYIGQWITGKLPTNHRLIVRILAAPQEQPTAWLENIFKKLDLTRYFELIRRVIIEFGVLHHRHAALKVRHAALKVRQAALQAALESALASEQVLNDMRHMLESARVPERVVYAVVVSAVSLLLLVYQYLMGHVDKGGTLTCSTGSFQFRATYISIVLFEGAYVWIKFRDVAPSRAGGYRRRVKNKRSGTIRLSKPEARYTPPGQSGDHIYLGVCATDEEAGIKKQIAASCYGRGQGTLDLGQGHHFQIPSVQMELEQLNLPVKEERKWVRDKVREVYASFDKAQKAILRASLHEVDVGEYYKSWEKLLELDSSPDMMLDSQPPQDDQVQSAMVVSMLNGRDDCPVHAEPLGTAHSRSSRVFLDDVAPSIGIQDEGALTTQHCAPQIPSNRELPMVNSTFIAHPGMDQQAAVSDVVTPPQTNFCPTDSTPYVLAMKIISLHEQKIQDQQKILDEALRMIHELKLENEKLRALIPRSECSDKGV